MKKILRALSYSEVTLRLRRFLHSSKRASQLASYDLPLVSAESTHLYKQSFPCYLSKRSRAASYVSSWIGRTKEASQLGKNVLGLEFSLSMKLEGEDMSGGFDCLGQMKRERT